MGGPPLSRRELGAVTAFIVGSLIAIMLAFVGLGGRLPFEADGYRFTVAFPNAPTLVAGSSVRISGVPVGKVISVRAGQDTTLALIQLDPNYSPLPRDARAMIRNKTPLGESYIELTPGTPGAKPLPDGGRLPAAQVGTTEQIADLLSVFDAPTRRAFQTVMTDTAAALAGEGPNLNAALGASGTTAEQLNILLQALSTQSDSVRALVSRSADALHALAAQPAALQQLITSGNAVLSTSARRSSSLTATVGSLARFVASLKATAGPLTTASNLATPTLRTLTAVAPLIEPALPGIEHLAPEARDVFEALRPAATDAERGLPAAEAILARLPALGTTLDAAGSQLVPLVQLVAAYDHDAVTSIASFASALEAVKGTSGSTGSRYARTAIEVGSDGDLGFQERPPFSRYNPYPPPGENGDDKSLNCENVNNPAPIPASGSQVPCEVEAPWLFRGARRSFPLLTPYAPTPLAPTHRAH